MPDEKSAAQPGVFVEPLRRYNFRMTIGQEEAKFTECSSIGARVEVIRYRSGGLNEIVHCLPGRVEYKDVTMCYGLTQSRTLWDWFSSAVSGKVIRQNVSILLLDADGVTEKVRYNLLGAWVAAFNGALLDARTSEVAIESVTLTYEGLERG